MPVGPGPGQVPAQPLALRMTDITPGTVIDDYIVTGKIGEGGMGTVYGAEHPKLGKQVAIKVLRAELSANVDATTRFEQEALTLSKLGHPNIVDVSSLGTLPDGRAYFVMERLVGEDLGRAQQHAPLGLREICNVLNAVARALEAAHAKGIVHRDLKPENIFLHRVDAEAPTVKLLDFGIAKLSTTDAPQRTRTGSMMGTPRYVSPEQARGVGVDYRTDIYSLGVVTFELVARKAPFEGETGMDIMLGHLTQVPPRLASLANVPAMLDDIVNRMLAKEASARPSLADARAVFRAIEAGNDTPMLAAGTTWPQRNTTGGSGDLIRPPGVTPGALGAIGTPGMAPAFANRSAAMSGIDDTVLPAATPVGPPMIVSPGYANTLAGPGVAIASPAVVRTASAKAKSSKNMWASIAMTALAIAGGLIFFVNTQKGNESASPTAHAVPRVGGSPVASTDVEDQTREDSKPKPTEPSTTSVHTGKSQRVQSQRVPGPVPTPIIPPRVAVAEPPSAPPPPPPPPPPVGKKVDVQAGLVTPNSPNVTRGDGVTPADKDAVVLPSELKIPEKSLKAFPIVVPNVDSKTKGQRRDPVGHNPGPAGTIRTTAADDASGDDKPEGGAPVGRVAPTMFTLSIQVVGLQSDTGHLRIRIDGKDVGEGPILLATLTPGLHKVELMQGDRVVSSQRVDLKRNSEIKLRSQAKKN